MKVHISDYIYSSVHILRKFEQSKIEFCYCTLSLDSANLFFEILGGGIWGNFRISPHENLMKSDCVEALLSADQGHHGWVVSGNTVVSGV